MWTMWRGGEGGVAMQLLRLEEHVHGRMGVEPSRSLGAHESHI